MDQHAIPQDVTGFQFKLIGSMTVKQFGFVAVGVITAVVLYYLPLHFAFAFLIKTLLIPAFGASGFIVAFLPIDGRPVDVMAGNFIKAFMSPNQYVYHKMGYTFSFSTIALAKAPAGATQTATPHQRRQANNKELQLQMYLQNSQRKIKNSLDEREFAFLKTVATTAAPPMPAPTTATIHSVTAQTNLQPQIKPGVAPAVQRPVSIPSAPASIQSSGQIQPIPPQVPLQSTPVAPQTNNVGALIQEENSLEKQLEVAKNDERTQHTPQTTSAAHEKVLALEQQIQKIHAEKLRLEQELVRLKQQQQQAAATPAAQPPASPTQSQGKPNPQIAQQFSVAQVKTAPQTTTKNNMVPHIPDTPNILVGLVKDSRGNVLPHMLVEVKDKDGNPVRAFKTNALGQFASATPLANGIYTIELEDPKRQNTFDVIQVIANNKIILPLEIISHDAREQLRRELFN